MKKTAVYLILLLSLSYLCMPRVKHADPFYSYDAFDTIRIPLIKPIEVNRRDPSSPWRIGLHPALWIVDFPDNQGIHYPYSHVEGLEEFAVKNGIIMAYSSYVDKEASAYIQDNYYHWFVMIPDKEISKGFHTEEEFHKYIQTLGVGDPDWQTPDEAHKQFRKTGCLEWIPDCK
ncbi:MAG: hypothetical protein HPY45_06835 [Anaerolineae bacterium]|nr:hypothetical protein [Anaerolineae bacterium]